MKSRLIVFDFDGVLCDSLRECLWSSYRAYQALKKRREVPLEALEKIPSSVKRIFLAMRPFVRSGEDYVLVHVLIEQKRTARNQEAFDRYRRQFKSKLPEFKQKFYKERDHLFMKDASQWLSLNTLFPKISKAFVELDPERVHILTTKRKKDVQRILDHQGVRVAAYRITHANAKEKIEKLRKIISKYKVKPEQVTFVEDQREYLYAAQRLGINVCLPSWSYHSEEAKKRAADAHLKVITASQLKRL